MNRRQKLLMLTLLAAVLSLIAAILSFRLAEPEGDPTDSGTPTAEARSTVELFPGSNGRWGARTASGRVLIEPTWYYLKKMSDAVLIARYSDGKTDRFGLITANGAQLVPFLYTSISLADPTEPDLWFARFTENGRECCHLYHADGTRWSDTAWESCTFESGLLSVSQGYDVREGRLRDGRISWISRRTEYPVGLHRLILELDEQELRQLPSAETVSQLSEAAAEFLRYLFVTQQAPDGLQGNAENSAAEYRSCRLISAEISRIKLRQTDGLPSYLVQMQVDYQRTEDDGTMECIRTAMELTLTQNAAGAVTYTDFADAQMNAAGGRLN